MSSFKANSNDEPNKLENTNDKTHTRTTLELIPFDWETEIEGAENEPLPEVEPIAENSSEFTSLEISEKNLLDPLISLKLPQKDNFKPLSTKIIEPSKDPISKLKTPSVPILKLNGRKIESSIGTPMKSMAPIPEKPSSISELGVSNIPLITPVKKTSSEKENFINPMFKPRLHHMRNPPTKLAATPLGKKIESKTITPINNFKLLKHIEPASASRIQMNRTKTEKFSKIFVNGTEYINLKVLGKGGFSVVYQCFDDVAKENRAIKCVTFDSLGATEDYKKEIEILTKLQNCDRIIKMYSYQFLMQEKKLYVVLEMGSVDLSQILKNLSNNRSILPSYLILFYWMEMLYAVQQIHRNGIIHSDLKPANFLQINGRLKLIDFGISSCIQNDGTSIIKTETAGSSNYISPEALNYESSTNVGSPNYGKKKYKISFKADVWSLGCIFYELIYKRPPFHHIPNLMQKLMAIATGKGVIEYSNSDDVPKKFLETIKKCLVFNAKSRPSVDELIEEYEKFCKM